MYALSLSLFALHGIPLVVTGDSLPAIIFQALEENDLALVDNDVLVIAQKIVSKAEGRVVDLETVRPGKEASRLAIQADKDPRLVELILRESKRVIRCKPGVIIVEHHSGIVMANAGIDHSNVVPGSAGQHVALLPENADESAIRLRRELEKLCARKIGLVINDSVGRAWRTGTVGIAIGSSGIPSLRDLRGETDLFGNLLQVSETADADSLASAACLLMGEAADASPVVLVRGYPYKEDSMNARTLIRPEKDDMFR